MKFQLTLLSAGIAAVLAAGHVAASDRELDVAMDVVDSVDSASTFEMPLGGADNPATHVDGEHVATTEPEHPGDAHPGEGVGDHHGDVPGTDHHGDMPGNDHHGDVPGADHPVGDATGEPSHGDDVAGVDEHEQDGVDDDVDDADDASAGQVSDIHEGKPPPADGPGSGDGMPGGTGSGDGMTGVTSTGGVDGMGSSHGLSSHGLSSQGLSSLGQGDATDGTHSTHRN